MALSFEESLKKAKEKALLAQLETAQAPGVMTLEGDGSDAPIAAYSPENFGISAASVEYEDWVLDPKYEYLSEYSDDNYSVIDEKKNIKLADNQINITQEKNSQYIPFKMSRYYDGFDLQKTNILIYFVNKNKNGDYAQPINVHYSDKSIRFAWLVDERATAIEGTLSFEIQAHGANSKGQTYVWKTKPSDSINVLKSLSDNGGIIEPDSSWVSGFLSQVTEQVALAQQAARNAEGSVAEVADYAAQAAESAAQAQGVIDNAKEELELTVGTAVDSAVAEALSNYYTKAEVDEIVENIDISDQLNEVKAEIAAIDGLAAFDVKYDGSVMTFYNGESVMKTIEINSDPTEEWTEAYTGQIDKKISDGDTAVETRLTEKITAQETALSEYKTATDEDLGSIHEAIDGLPETLREDYYTKEDSDAKYASKTSIDNINTNVNSIAASAATNKENITGISTQLAELQDVVSGIDTSPQKTYDIIYNNLEDENSGENVLVFYEIENEKTENEVKTVKQKYTITGGGGGTTSSNTLLISYDKDENDKNITQYVFTVDNVLDKEAVIYYDFSGTDPVGDSISYASATWQIRKGTSGAWTTIKTETVYPGVDIPFNASDYLSSDGTFSLRLSVSDDTNAYASKTWSVQRIDFKIESTFNDRLTYPIGTVAFDFTPYGAISKKVHLILDGEEIAQVTTSASGIPSGYDLPAQKHGAHLLEAYMTAVINGSDIESNHIVKDIIWYDSSSTVPVIGTTYQNFAARQYDATNIEYTVYDPSTETPTVEIAVDGVIVSTPTLETSTNTYTYKTDKVGEHVITITCGDVVKTLTATITKIDIDITPVTTGLVFDFNPSGKSNNDTDRVWNDGNVAMSVSDNFDWVNGGYQYDENGDQYFCIKAGTSAEIDYKLFADDAKKSGKEFKLVFRTMNVAKPDATFLSCMDNTTDTDHIGIRMDVHEAVIYGQGGSLALPYSEEDIIEFEFNINSNTASIPMVMGYEDGVSTRPMVYDDTYNFTQNTPKIISLGSTDCDLHIYRLKVYSAALTDRGILNNFIADARNAEEMIKRYERNQIYDENSQLDPDILAERCPWLRVYKLSAPYFTNNKSDKVPGTTIQQIYKDGDPILDNWTCYDCSHSGQGTSSNNYGASGRNLDFIMNKSQIEGVKPYFILGDGSRASKITMTRTSVPVAYLNAKVNIASSNNLTNAMLANRYNEFEPYKRPFIRTADLSDKYSDEEIAAMSEDQRSKALAELQAKVDSEIPYIKNTMEFHNCVIFIQETNEDVSTHREFADNNWHFYAIGNIGDSKKTDDTRLTDINDRYECCVEIMDVELPLSDFPVNTMYNAMGYTVDEKTEERIYTWAKDENLGILYELIDGEYVLTEDTAVDLNKTYYVDILLHDDFSEDFTYGWRYLWEDGTDEENAEVFDYCKQKWIELYRFVTTSSDEDFKAHLGDYFVLDSALYNYLFTTRYCMVDNRAKNTFWHYGKTGEVDSDGNPVRKWDLTWDYDNDTACGLNNYGAQVYRYGLEDTDVDEKGIEVFRESDSTFFCRVRDVFSAELKAMYNTLESKNAWHAESFLNKCDAWQNEFPEELWRVDIERKYIRTYNESFINGEGDAQFLKNMSNGKMKYHRRQWERSQEKYMASKYQSSAASSDNSVFRCEVPNGDLVVKPNYRLKLTPYAYMYLNVKYGTQSPIQLRAEPNVEYEIPFDGEKADIVDVYSASLIQDFGDLSACYIATADTSKASKVKRLIFGNDTEGYDNPSFTTLTTGANYLLEELNIENVSGLTQSLDLSALNNLKELYAHGSNITGVTFADGGNIETAELPAIGALKMKELAYLSKLDITSLDKLISLTSENCDSIDLLTLINGAANLNRVRITGVEWSLEDTSLLERIYKMSGFDKNGYNIDKSVLSGSVFVPIIKERQLYDYNLAWPDLEIRYDAMTPQFAVTFKNDDGTTLEVQYVDRGADAVDPATREQDRIIPEKESTVSHTFTFSGWNDTFTNIRADKILYATYSSELRTYTIRYISTVSGSTVVHQESTGLYGSYIPYAGEELPVYTGGESEGYYYLFDRWDKSGYIDGDKTVTAIFDMFDYTDNSAFGELSEMTPVKLYAMSKIKESLGVSGGVDKGAEFINNIVSIGDRYTLKIGNDIDYDDIESKEIVKNYTGFDGTSTRFTGSSGWDTGISLFDSDRDFVLAVDYEFTGGSANDVLMECCKSVTGIEVGFRLSRSSSSASVTWCGANSNTVSTVGNREMLVIQYVAAEKSITLYSSNISGEAITVSTLNADNMQSIDKTLMFGAYKANSGVYESKAVGNVNWCKVWYGNLGEDVCRELAMWIHEDIPLIYYGSGMNTLYDDDSRTSSLSFIADQLLDRKFAWNKTGGNIGGWHECSLKTLLNERLISGIPAQMRQLVKKVGVKGSVGNSSSTVISSGNYIYIPSLSELGFNTETSPFNQEGTPLSLISLGTTVKKADEDGVYSDYWTRSPYIYANGPDKYVWRITGAGTSSGVNLAANLYNVLIMLSV